MPFRALKYILSTIVSLIVSVLMNMTIDYIQQ